MHRPRPQHPASREPGAPQACPARLHQHSKSGTTRVLTCIVPEPRACAVEVDSDPGHGTKPEGRSRRRTDPCLRQEPCPGSGPPGLDAPHPSGPPRGVRDASNPRSGTSRHAALRRRPRRPVTPVEDSRRLVREVDLHRRSARLRRSSRGRVRRPAPTPKEQRGLGTSQAPGTAGTEHLWRAAEATPPTEGVSSAAVPDAGRISQVP